MEDDKLEFLEELGSFKEGIGIITLALQRSGFDRSDYDKWYEEDDDFRKEVDFIRTEVVLDYAESCLHKAFQKGTATALAYFLKCKGKSRGYDDKSSVDPNQMGDIDFDFGNMKFEDGEEKD